MKSYQEVIELVGKQMFDRYMSGSNIINSPSTIIAFIFNTNADLVNDDINLVYQRIKTEFYSKRNE